MNEGLGELRVSQTLFYEKRYIGYVGIASDTILKEKVIMEMIEFMKNKTFLKTI